MKFWSTHRKYIYLKTTNTLKNKGNASYRVRSCNILIDFKIILYVSTLFKYGVTIWEVSNMPNIAKYLSVTLFGISFFSYY